MVRMTTELETNIVAVERVKEYTETPTEVYSLETYSKTSLEDHPDIKMTLLLRPHIRTC